MMASLETLHAVSENGVRGQKIGYPKSKQRVVLLSDYTVSQSTLGVRTNLSTTPSRRSKLETKLNTLVVKFTSKSMGFPLCGHLFL